MKKNKSHYPKNWDEISISVKTEAGWRCEKCGEAFEPGCNIKYFGLKSNRKQLTFTVHHKDRNPMNNKRENLIALCSACHCRAELPIIRQEKRAETHRDQVELF